MKAATSNRARLWQVIRLCGQCVYLKTAGRGEELPRVIYLNFRILGGIYVKFLQLLVSQSETFRSLSEYDVYDVYDQVAYDDIDIQALLHKELGAAASKLKLTSIMPFASGSFGQVYQAEYEGRMVILKVLRPSVIRSLSFDLRLVAWFSRLIDIFAPGSTISATKVCKELARVTRAETDYLLEADYASKLYQRYHDHEAIHIPYTFRELSTNHIICQEYVGGISATELLKLRDQGADAQQYVRDTLGSDLVQQMVAFGTEFLYSVFAYGSTYGDPHPGNIKFLPGNKVAFIDFGLQAVAPKNLGAFQSLVRECDNMYQGKQNALAYARALLDTYGGDVIEAAHSIDAYSIEKQGIIDNLLAHVEHAINNGGPQIRELIEENRMPTLFNNVINKDNRFCLKYNTDGPEFLRASGLFIMLAKMLDVKRPVMSATYRAVVEKMQTTAPAAPADVLHPETAIEVLAAWLDQISYRNPALHQQILHSGGLLHV